jgi:hypothetical protein
MQSDSTARLGLRLIVLGLSFLFLAPAIMLFPEAAIPPKVIGVLWAVAMSVACGVTLLVIGLSLRERREK